MAAPPPARHDPAPRPLRELALLLLLSTLWGGSYAFIRVGVQSIPPITLITARTLIAGLLLLGVMAWRGVTLPRDGATWRRLLLQACLNSVIPFTLIAWAQQSVGAALATILNSSSPIFVFLLTVLVTRQEPVTWRKGLGVAAGLLGITLVAGVEALRGIGAAVWPQLAIVAATVCYAGAAIFGRGFGGLHPLVPAAGSMLCGAVVLLPFSLWLERPWTLQPTAASLVALLGLSALSTALAFVIYFRLIRTLGAVGTTAQAYLRVPIGVALGVLLLGESLAPTAWIGMACVVAGVIAMNLPARPSRP